ncbi:MAG: IS1634 family transposase [Selenomonadaceae bacterium]|nr:IS1634 family transposase [Selenomonadaceae bacterium]
MFVEQFKNNGVPYLRLVQSYRVEDSQGRKVSRKKTILNIGPLSRFDDGEPDFVQRLKDSYKEGKPIIDLLLPYIEEPVAKKHVITFEDGDMACIGTPKLVSQILLDRLFVQLGLDKLCATLKHSLGLSYDLTGFIRLLIFGRILQPASKWETAQQNAQYFAPLADTTYPYHIYDALDVLAKYKEQFIHRMHSSICKTVGRSSTHIYYDVTNFFFEIEKPDPNEDIGDGVQKGLRQKGVSKENRKEPIVQMGMFLDDNGIPITIETFPGNTLDQATLRPALKKSMGKLETERFVLVADRGLHSFYNLCHLVSDGQGYIVSKSIRKTPKAERQWIMMQEDYIAKGNSFKFKSRIVTRRVKDENGVVMELKEKVIVYWSERFYMREYNEHKSFLDFLERLRQNPASFRITAIQSNKLKKFFKREFVHKDTGEIIESGKLLGMLDEEKIEELTAFMGYYQIVTSEIDMPDEDVIEAYHGLTQIEDQFREMKGTLSTRPIYVSTQEHIQAHLLICMIALTMLRLIQKKIISSSQLEQIRCIWSYGMSGRRVQTALQKWQIDKLPGDVYRFNNTTDDDLKRILSAFSINIMPKLYTRGDLRKIKTEIKL